MSKRLFRAFGCALYVGHQLNLAPAQGAKAIASFRVWGFSVWKMGVLFYSKWVGR
jgi:hypothetical protein